MRQILFRLANPLLTPPLAELAIAGLAACLHLRDIEHSTIPAGLRKADRRQWRRPLSRVADRAWLASLWFDL